jgi:hypothetical protein
VRTERKGGVFVAWHDAEEVAELDYLREVECYVDSIVSFIIHTEINIGH